VTTSRKPKKSPYHQILDGEWIEPTMTKFTLQCCDCALTHRLDFKKTDKGLKFRTRIDARATAAARRVFRFTD
jgi:hypothetical protein